MRKTLSILFLLAVALCGQASAQLSQCAITATIYDNNGDLLSGARIVVVKVVKNGSLISNSPLVYTTNASGVATFNLPRSSVAWIWANSYGLNANGSAGVAVTVPAAASANLEELAAFSSVLTTLGDLAYGGASGVFTRLAGNVSSTAKFLCQQGNGTTSTAPGWCAFAGSGNLTLTYDNNARTATFGYAPSSSELLAALGSQSANRVLASPDGSSGTMSVRALVAADIPNLSSIYALTSHAHAATDLTSGTIPDARFPATLPAASGANLTALNASNIASGSLALARIAQGGASTNEVLTWNGSAWAPATTAGITGSGATNRLALWSGTSAQTSDSDLSYALDSLNAPNLSVLEKQRWSNLEGIGSFSNGGSSGSGNVRLGDVTSTIAGGDGAYNAFPGLTRLPDGRLFVCYRVGTAHTTGGVLKYKISSDQGRTWSAATTIYTASGNEQVQDTEATLLRNGLIMVVWFNYDTVTTLSSSKSMLGTIASDGTISWGSPRAITSNFTTETVASAKPVELPDGSLIIPVYGKGAGDTYYSTAAVKSTDQGATWGSHVTIASNPSSKQYNEAAIARLTDGTLVAIVRHETDLTGYDRSVSTDNGATWSSPTNVINLSGQLPGRPSLAVLGSGGLFMMYRTAPATTIGYATSWDNGVTWSSTSFGSQLYEYASVTLQSGGSIGVAYAVNTSGDVASNLTYQEFYDGYGLFGGGTIEAKKLRVAGTTELSGNLGIYQTSPSTAIELGGTAARTIGMARNTGGFVGQALTIKAGGGTEFIANRAGGDLIFESGQTTGNSVGADFIFRATTAGSSGITDNSYSTKAVIKGETGAGGFGAAPAVGNLLSAYGGASIGSPYGAVAAPTDGMIVYGLVGIRTNTPGYINSINYGTQLTVAGNGGFALTSAIPYWLMNETDQSADSRILDFTLNSGVFSVRKYTDAGGSVVDLLKITRSSGEFEIPSKIKADASSTADETRLLLWDVSAGAFVRVSRGAADSCGSGFRCLRIPN